MGESKDSAEVSKVERADSQVPATLDVPHVTWWKHAGLRRLYCMMPILFLGATINGYVS